MIMQRHRTALVTAILLAVTQSAVAELNVTNIQAVHRNGQTFVTWTDVAAGDAGADYRYSLYVSERPITETSLTDSKPAIH